MNSKEALEELRCVLVSNQVTKRYSDIFEENLLRPIKKDLEILEIIKKKNVATFLIPCCNNARDYSMKTSGFEALTDKEFKLLKEWMKNE